MKRHFLLSVLSFTAIFLIAGLQGCTAITIPNPGDIASTPLGTESIKLGMSKARVESIWGKPDNIRIEESKDSFKGQREVWFYNSPQYARIAPPVNAGYLSRSRKLYFDGNNLIDIQ